MQIQPEKNGPHHELFTPSQSAELTALLGRLTAERFKVTNLGPKTKAQRVLLWPGSAFVHKLENGDTRVVWVERRSKT
jgi:hypothetical protein